MNSKKPNHGTRLKTSHGLSSAGAVLEPTVAKPELWLLCALPLRRLTSLPGRSFTPVTKGCLAGVRLYSVVHKLLDGLPLTDYLITNTFPYCILNYLQTNLPYSPSTALTNL